MKNIYEHIINESNPPVIVAEAGINHNGNFQNAKLLVKEAAKAGADIIKFQTHISKYEMLKEGFTAEYVGGSLYELLERMMLTKEQHLELMSLAKENNILFLSTPFSREAADMLDELGMPIFKIGSGETTNLPLLKYIARKGKPMIISTGMTTLEEIKETVEAIIGINSKLVLMHCTSTYPTEYRDVRLKVIQILKDMFLGIPIGLSDHSLGIYTALGAVSLGARIIEKHFTISRSWEGSDQRASIEPQELKELVNGCCAIYESMQVSHKLILKEECDVQKMARESVVTIKDIRKGDIFSKENIWVKRPGTGIPAKEYENIIGRKAKYDLKKDSLLNWDVIL